MKTNSWLVATSGGMIERVAAHPDWQRESARVLVLPDRDVRVVISPIGPGNLQFYLWIPDDDCWLPLEADRARFLLLLSAEEAIDCVRTNK